MFRFKEVLFIFLLIYMPLLKVFAQDTLTVHLNRRVEPKFIYNKFNDDYIRENFLNTTMSWAKNIMAGDYSKGNTKFTIARCLSPECVSPTIYIAPYKADTIYVGDGITMYHDRYGTPAIMLVGEKEFKVLFGQDNTELKLIELPVNNIKPDVKLYDSCLPKIEFPLLNGGKKLFTSFEHKHAFIYVELWGDTSYFRYNVLKEARNTFKDNLIIISLVTWGLSDKIDTNIARKIVKEHDLDWTQGISNDDIDREFFHTPGITNGVLFSSEGKILKLGLNPTKLKETLVLVKGKRQ